MFERSKSTKIIKQVLERLKVTFGAGNVKQKRKVPLEAGSGKPVFVAADQNLTFAIVTRPFFVSGIIA